MKRNMIKIIVSTMLVHLISACTPIDFTGSGTVDFRFPENNVNQQQGSAKVVASLDREFATIKEGETLELAVRLDKAASSDIILRLTSPGGEAKAAEDFIIAADTIVIPQGSLSASFQIQAIADSKVEQAESFFGELEVFQSDLVTLGAKTISIMIQDSAVAPPPGGGAAPVVSLVTTSGVASEAQGSYQVPVVLDKPSTQSVTVSFTAAAGSTAIMGQDYILQNAGQVVIPAGMQSGILIVSIIDDNTPEATKSVSLTISNAVNATVGSVAQYSLSLMDNDAATPPPAALPIASFSMASASVSEAQANYSVAVTLDKPAPAPVTISFSSQGVGAVQGVDYTIAQAGSISIAQGAQSAMINFSIIDDNAVEQAESVSLVLSSAVGATIGSASQFSLSIVDNDAANNTPPIVSLAAVSGAASEGQGTYNLVFNLNKVSAQPVTVMLVLSGSALQNQDFSLPMGDNIIIPAGSVSASLPIVIIDDAVNESTENAVFTIASVQGATLGANTSFNFSIMDNDAAPNVDPNLQAYTETLYNNIQRNANTGRCFNCHRPNGTQLQISPFHSHDDPAVALQTIQAAGLVNLNNPSISRLVTKVEGGHYPWSGDSIADAALIASYIQMWADRVNNAGNNNGGTPGNNNKISTNELMLSEGQEVEGTVRYTAEQIAFWDFKKGADENTIYDVSGVGTPINLEMSGDIEWLGGQGITCNQNANGGKAQASVAASRKLHQRLTATNQFTLEAWISSTDKTQGGPTRIMSYSNGTANRNFTMGQEQEYFEFRNRNAETGNNGSNPEYAPNGTKFVGDRPQNHHVVMIYDGRKRSLYVNGALVAGNDAAASNNVLPLNGWNDDYRFLFCNETSNNRSFKGSIFMAAVHERALTGAQVMQNYEAGFTKKLALKFDIAQYTNPGAKMEVQVELQGNYVIASNPRFTGLTSNIDVAGIKFAVDGQDVPTGQSYSFLEKSNAGNNEDLSDVASILKVDDPGTAKISANFQQLGNMSKPVETLIFPYEGDNTAVANPEAADDSAIRLFSELNQSMANVTGVSPANANIKTVYDEIKSGLPTDRGLDTFTSSHQINIIKLAYEYCNEMVNDASLRTAFYGNISLNQTIGAADKNTIAEAISRKAIGRNIASQADDSTVTQEVTGLVDEMLGFNRSTSDILKGACVLGVGSMNNLVK